MKVLSAVGVIFSVFCAVGCAAEASPEPTAPAPEKASTAASELAVGYELAESYDPLKCYADCTAGGGSAGTCDTRCQCNGQCN